MVIIGNTDSNVWLIPSSAPEVVVGEQLRKREEEEEEGEGNPAN